MKRLIAAAAVVLSLALVGSAGAASKQLWHLTALDAAASEIAGFPVSVDASDSIAEWNALTGDDPTGMYVTMGFTFVDSPTNGWMYDPWDGKGYLVYHTVFLNPSIYATFQAGVATANPYDAATALMVLDHESQHQKLHSHDEGRVNACALADMARFTAKFMPSTVVQEVPVQQWYRVKVRYRARVHGHLVWRYHWVARSRYVMEDQTVENPAYAAVLAAAQDIYTNHQPAPYNTGTCW